MERNHIGTGAGFALGPNVREGRDACGGIYFSRLLLLLHSLAADNRKNRTMPARIIGCGITALTAYSSILYTYIYEGYIHPSDRFRLACMIATRLDRFAIPTRHSHEASKHDNVSVL